MSRKPRRLKSRIFLAEAWQHGYEDTKLDGCMFGLKNSQQVHFRKPWTIRSSWKGAFKALERKCDGSHGHAPCLGETARKSALYTPDLCRGIAREASCKVVKQ